MEIENIICCETIIRDVETNGVTLVNIIDGINSQTLPVFLTRFAIFIISYNTEAAAQFDATLEIFNNEQSMLKTDIKIIFDAFTQTRNVVRLNGFVIQNPGTVRVKVVIAESNISKEIKLPISSSTQVQLPV